MHLFDPGEREILRQRRLSLELNAEQWMVVHTLASIGSEFNGGRFANAARFCLMLHEIESEMTREDIALTMGALIAILKQTEVVI